MEKLELRHSKFEWDSLRISENSLNFSQYSTTEKKINGAILTEIFIEFSLMLRGTTESHLEWMNKALGQWRMLLSQMHFVFRGVKKVALSSNASDTCFFKCAFNFFKTSEINGLKKPGGVFGLICISPLPSTVTLLCSHWNSPIRSSWWRSRTNHHSQSRTWQPPPPPPSSRHRCRRAAVRTPSIQ